MLSLLLTTLLVALTAPAALAAGPIQTAVVDPSTFAGPEANLAFAHTRAAGATAVRLPFEWAAIAPTRPASPANPSDPAYRWAEIDRQIRLARANGLQPILGLTGAPRWAQGTPSAQVPADPVQPRFLGPFRPDPVAFGQFAKAAALRYRGGFAGLPRVRLWQAWNEPNISHFLSPQFVGTRPVSPAWYRRLLNQFATAVHGVHRDNVVITGGASAFAERADHAIAMAPLRFMRELLCLSAGRRPKPTCRDRAQFDVWAHHPYTKGGPTTRAARPDEVSLGDLPELNRLLQAAVTAKKVVSRQPVRLWVMEFSWDTGPPDPHPLVTPIRLHTRWVAESLYRMWRSGVSLVTWFLIRDEPYPASNFQSGLYFRRPTLALDQEKPAVAAFRFPFVAFRQGSAVSVWGRTPGGKRSTIQVERRTANGWARVTSLRTDRYGIFSRRLKGVPSKLTGAPAFPGLPVPAYRQAVLADAPSSYWRLEEGTGTVARDERGVRDGTYSGGVRLGVPSPLVGDQGRGLELDGRTGVVELGTVESPRTVELWVKTGTAAGGPLFSNRNEISQFSFLGVLGAGNAFVYDAVELQGTRWLTDEQWHHVAYVHDGLSGRLYVDGKLDGELPFAPQPGGGTAYIGYDAALKSHLPGAFDDVAVYDYPLSAEQVARHYAASGVKPERDPIPADDRSVHLRARAGGQSSVPFSLASMPNRAVLPFGGGGG